MGQLHLTGQKLMKSAFKVRKLIYAGPGFVLFLDPDPMKKNSEPDSVLLRYPASFRPDPKL